MSAPPWMPFYVADYLADTGHLSTAEHGAYMLLIMHYWQNRGVPTDDTKLGRIARMTPDEWAVARATLADLFDENWTHARIDAELAKADETMGKRSAAGKAGAEARYGKGKRRAKQTHADAIANAEQTHAPSPPPSPVDAASAASSAAPRNSVPRETKPGRTAEWFDDLERRLREAAGLENDPSPALRDVSPIVGLIDKGYDLDGEILPKLKAANAKGKRGRTWGYYLPSITEAHVAAQAIPAKPVSPLAAPQTWITQDDAAWGRLSARWKSEKGQAPPARGSRHESGIGHYFPAEWIEARAH